MPFLREAATFGIVSDPGVATWALVLVTLLFVLAPIFDPSSRATGLQALGEVAEQLEHYRLIGVPGINQEVVKRARVLHLDAIETWFGRTQRRRIAFSRFAIIILGIASVISVLLALLNLLIIRDWSSLIALVIAAAIGIYGVVSYRRDLKAAKRAFTWDLTSTLLKKPNSHL